MPDHALDDLPADEVGSSLQELACAPPAPPLRARIRELAIRRASGDLTCGATHAGVHAHLQGGRLAWAHDAAHPRAFAARLCELAGLDPAMVDALGKECLRLHRPLGETLVARGLATPEQVRAAVRSQVEHAFLGCHWCASCRAGFRDDGAGLAYDAALTFSVEELTGEPLQSGTPGPAAGEAEPSPIDWNVLVQGLEEPRDGLDLDRGLGPSAELPEAARRAVSEVLGAQGARAHEPSPTTEERAKRLAARLEAWLTARARH